MLHYPDRYLGKLCPLQHDHDRTGKSLRYVANGACCACSSIYQQRHREKHRERYNTYAKGYRRANKDRVNQTRREWRASIGFRRLITQLRSNARRRKIECTLTAHDLEMMWKGQQGRCYWLNMPITLDADAPYPTRASLDRINPNGGYTNGNVVWSSMLANCGRGDMEHDAFRLLLASLGLLGQTESPKIIR